MSSNNTEGYSVYKSIQDLVDPIGDCLFQQNEHVELVEYITKLRSQGTNKISEYSRVQYRNRLLNIYRHSDLEARLRYKKLGGLPTKVIHLELLEDSYGNSFDYSEFVEHCDKLDSINKSMASFIDFRTSLGSLIHSLNALQIQQQHSTGETIHLYSVSKWLDNNVTDVRMSDFTREHYDDLRKQYKKYKLQCMLES